MKKSISKILIIFIVIVMLFEFTFSSNVTYAADMDSETINSITNLIGGVVSIILWIPRLLTFAAAWAIGDLMTESFAESCGISDVEAFAGTEGKMATPFDIFFNKYNVFDVNFFNITSNGDLIDTIRGTVAQWFYVLRLVSAAVLLAVLIYVGIRMAISTIADDKAKYKKMLIDWTCSLALIFVLQYIAVFTINANNAIVNFLRDVQTDDLRTAIDTISDQATKGMGIGSLVATFVYCMIVFQTIAFMIAYLQRMLKVGFLIIISPLISITYSIDKMGDGKAQALNSWLKEFVYTILIQPFHCVMYLAFVNTAVGLVTTAPTITEDFWGAFAALADGKFNELANGFLIILCLKFINDGEKAIRKIFNFQDDGNMTSMAAGAVVGMAALSNAKKIGSATAKSFNTMKSIPTKFNKALAADRKKDGGAFGKAKESLANATKGWGDALKKLPGADKLNSAVNFAKDAVKKSSESGTLGKINNASKLIGGKAAGYKAKADKLREKAKDWYNSDENAKLRKTVNGAKTLGKGALKRSVPIALGAMGAAMSYATGTSGAMEALAVGTGMSKGSGEFFESTEGNLTSAGEDYAEDAVNEAIDSDGKIKDLQSQLDENTGKMDQAKRNLSEANGYFKGLEKYQKDKLGDVGEIEGKREDFAKQLANGSIDQTKYDEEIKKLDEEKKKLIDGDGATKGIGEGAYTILALKSSSEATIRKQGEIANALKSRKAQVGSEALKKLKNSGTASDIEKAKNDIYNIMIKAKMKQKTVRKEGDTNANNTLSPEETDSVERIQNNLCDLLDRSILGSDMKFDSRDFIKKHFGNVDSEVGEAMAMAIEGYRNERKAQLYNDTREKAGSLGIDKDRYDDRCLERITGTTSRDIIPEKKQQSSGANG